ncbi:hypothetical protein ACFLXG_01875 [Chloroflexota bacterium]
MGEVIPVPADGRVVGVNSLAGVAVEVAVNAMSRVGRSDVNYPAVRTFPAGCTVRVLM